MTCRASRDPRSPSSPCRGTDARGEGKRAERWRGHVSALKESLERKAWDGDSAAGVQRYKVEPYVIAADVYTEAPHVGRGGWTWYTGSAGWMYRAGLESILGFRLRGARLVMDPCIPLAWRGFEIVFRYRSARYDLVVENPRGVSRGVSSVEVDGVSLAGDLSIPLVDSGTAHRVRIVLG
jgi:cyclic beta-1,2-glucan synthetase